MKILYHNRSQVDARLTEAMEAEYRELEDLFRESDFLSVNVSLNSSTRDLIGARLLGLMKPGAPSPRPEQPASQGGPQHARLTTGASALWI